MKPLDAGAALCRARALTSHLLLACAIAVIGTSIPQPAFADALADSATRVDAPPVGLDQTATLRTSQAAIGNKISDFTLLDREGRAVRLSSYRGKPFILFPLPLKLGPLARCKTPSKPAAIYLAPTSTTSSASASTSPRTRRRH